MTHLAIYLNERGMKQAEFAAMLRVTQATVSRLASGGKLPSLKLASEIERATGGVVPASSWVDSPQQGAA